MGAPPNQPLQAYLRRIAELPHKNEGVEVERENFVAGDLTHR
ncbi:MAG: hypothetical protein AVDCRST_MAG89-5220 [uncultured Gemmatimonadetes bacterium]|uniref:Uncharacterized protein n=1 Tax=uncultured Gemmatimonadota bacterium TaxID=203437 RepID=A0A6J4N9V9_9BACT|nr:MAG: hypothetical protein AVDCRST_MAG89-5220 [uncultured Gemmatimonadota bacterium]